jgi:co-chaperonin GroES (HSP10)
LVEKGLSVGVKVLFTKNSGCDIKVGEEDLIILNEVDILAIKEES